MILHTEGSVWGRMLNAEEIRKQLCSWSQEDLLKLYTQTYRRLPKDVKEDIDTLILEGMPSGKRQASRAKAAPAVDLEALTEKIDVFLELAQDGYYFSPNRTVSKKERANWRFTVKGFIKALRSVPETQKENYRTATLYLIRIYQIMGHACSFYTFASQDPFHAVGYASQTACFEELTRQVLQTDCDHDLIAAYLKAACAGDNDTETLNRQIHGVIYQLFPPDMLRNVILPIAQEVFAPIRNLYKARYKETNSLMIADEQIRAHAAYDSFVWMIAETLHRLDGWETMYRFIKEEHPETEAEVSLYIMLQYYTRSDEEFVALYEQGVKDHIKPRESLTADYQACKAHLS